MPKIIEAIKKIYPEINGGFVYWETKYCGTPWDHPSEGLVWDNAQFQKPSWEQIEKQILNVEIEETKLSKICQLRINRDLENDKDFLVSIMLGNDLCTFRIRKSDSETLQRRINKLINTNLSTSVWTDVDGFRRELTLAQFQDLKRTFDNHLNDRDAEIYSHYFETKDAINDASTLEELNNININFS